MDVGFDPETQRLRLEGTVDACLAFLVAVRGGEIPIGNGQMNRRRPAVHARLMGESRISAEGRARIAEAQKRRWANARKNSGGKVGTAGGGGD